MVETLKERIAERVRALRTARGLTQEGLADLIEGPVETISNIERSSTLPSLRTVERLCHAFNLSLAEFFDFPDEGNATEQSDARTRIWALTCQLDSDQLALAERLIAAVAETPIRSRTTK